MAGYPPPPPPYSAPPPFGFDPRQQQRMMRDQARAQAQAQKAAFRAQRDSFRMQMRNLRRSSILGPLLVLAIGIVALLIVTGRMSLVGFSGWYAHWWPLLIVAAGLVLVAEWALDLHAARDGAPSVRRGIGGGAIVLLILLMFTGLTARSIHNNHDMIVNGLSINPDNLEEVFGEKYEREQQIDQAFAPGTSLFITNPHGDVTVTGKSGDDKIHITVNKQVYSSNESAADSKADSLRPQMDLAGTTLRVTLPGSEGFVSDLSITVPDTGATTVSADRGDVHISALHAPVNITANRGDIEVNDVNGALQARINSSHASFAAHHVTGDVSLKGRADNLSVTDVGGQVQLEGEFFGDTHMERLLGPVSFHTSRTQFSVAKLTGEVDISPDSELSGSDITGPTELKTRSRTISLQHVSGSVDVTNTNGAVDISDSLPLGAVTVNNKNGAVNLTLPDHAGVSVDAETHDGQVENELALQSVSANEHSELHGTVGDGAAKVSLHTTHADITIHKQEMAAPPAPPAMPAAPVAPAVRKQAGKGGKLTAKPAPSKPADPRTQTF